MHGWLLHVKGDHGVGDVTQHAGFLGVVGEERAARADGGSDRICYGGLEATVSSTASAGARAAGLGGLGGMVVSGGLFLGWVVWFGVETGKSLGCGEAVAMGVSMSVLLLSLTAFVWWLWRGLMCRILHRLHACLPRPL